MFGEVFLDTPCRRRRIQLHADALAYMSLMFVEEPAGRVPCDPDVPGIPRRSDLDAVYRKGRARIVRYVLSFCIEFWETGNLGKLPY